MYLWSFLTYGFLGYLLEKVYALVTRSATPSARGICCCRCVRYTALPCWRCWLCRRI